MPDTKSLKEIDLSKVKVHSITATEKFYRKLDSSGNVVNNRFPGCFVVHCSYLDNDNYIFIATDKEVEKLKGTSAKEEKKQDQKK